MNRKLLEIIVLLTKEDARQFRQFLASPYFVKGAQGRALLTLFDYLYRHATDPASKKLQKKFVAAQVLGVADLTPAASKRLDKLGTELLDLMEQFLWVEQCQQEQPSIQIALTMMRFWGKNQSEKRFWQATDHARKIVQAIPFRGSDYFRLEFELQFEITRYSTQFSSLKIELGTTDALLAFDEYNTQKRLEIAIIQQNQLKLFNASIVASPLQEMWLQQIALNQPSQSSVTQVMLKSLELIRADENSQAEIEALETAIIGHQDILPGEMFLLLFTNVRNLMIRFWNQKQQPELTQWLFERLANHLEKGWMSTEGKLSTNALRTCLVLSLKVGATAWARKLLEDYPPEKLTGTKYPDEFCQIHWSYFYFNIGDYEKAEQLLLQVNFEYQLFSLLADVQLIQIYFESDNPLLEFRLKALEQKVRRSNQTPSWKKRISRFLYFTEKILLLKLRPMPEVLSDLKSMILKEIDLVEKNWLLSLFDRIPRR